jgi:ParB-like chromosome segregation protein Spo0J
MTNIIRSIVLKKLIANSLNPNQMSKSNFIKLARNIGKTGQYEALIVRSYSAKKGFFQIINGYHRAKILMKLGYKNADCVVWNVDDDHMNLLTATLNRLVGKDDTDKKIKLLKCLIEKMTPAELSKYLLQTKKQIQRFADLGKPGEPTGALHLFNTMVFFVTDIQKEKIEKAFSSLEEQVKDEKTKAFKNAASLTILAEFYITHFNI